MEALKIFEFCIVAIVLPRKDKLGQTLKCDNFQFVVHRNGG